MDLGAFSISLGVRDLDASRAFYTCLGFQVIGGAADKGYLIMRNGEHVIGLFKGMFEGTMLTFNPGWSQMGEELPSFTDVRKLKERLVERGIEIEQETGGEAGPGSFVVVDPDGNPVLVDQHV